MKLQNKPSIEFELISVIPNKKSIYKTFIPDISNIYFIHQLIQKDVYIVVQHSIEFIPTDRKETVQDSQFGSQIFSDVAASIFSLLRIANEE